MTDPCKDFLDDPRLTAYSLGELEGAERAEIESLVRRHPAAAAAVEEIRRLAGSLTEALKEEAIDIRPAAEIVPIESGRRSVLRRLQPYFFVASGLAAGWATALLLFRPPPHLRLASPIAQRAVSVLAEKRRSAAASEPTPSPPPPGAQPQQVATFGFVGRGYPPWPKGDPLPQVQSMKAPAVIVDSAQLRDDLRHFELVQPALGAGARIVLGPKESPIGEKDADVVKLSPFEVASDNQDSFAANTLSGTRINSQLSDAGSQIRILSKEQRVSYADSASANTISGATIPAGIPAPSAPASAGHSSQPPARVVFGRAELLPLAGGSKPPVDDIGRPHALAGIPAPAGQAVRGLTLMGGALPTAADSLVDDEIRLRALHVIDGTPAGQAGLPGEFSRLYLLFLRQGNRAAYERMMTDPNPEVSAMGALCLMSADPADRADVLAKMSSDPRPIAYVRAGSAPQFSTLGVLFHSIASDPNFLFFLGSPPARP